MSALQSLSEKGRIGINPLPSTAPFPVPDSDSHWVSSGGDDSHQPHNVGGTTRTSAVGACEVSTERSTTPSVHYNMSHNVSVSNRTLFRQNTYLQNKKHTLTCQGGDWLLQILITSPVVSWRGSPPPQHRSSTVILCSTTAG